jgi:amino acid adenylation domain-containing protein
MERRLDGFFSASAQRHPTRPALFVGGREWSYAELDAYCTTIEQALHAAGLCGRHRNIGLVYGKSALSYAAVIAIMRSGNTYVPLNPKLPAPRLNNIIDDAGIEALIVDSSEALSDSADCALRQSRSLILIISQYEADSSLEKNISSWPQHSLWRIPYISKSSARTPEIPSTSYSSKHVAYILYTSGSTGVPKGVAVTHDCAWRCIEKVHQIVETNERDRFTQFSALLFDISIADIFLCWKSAGSLYVPAPHEALVPLKFAVSHEITVWSSVPSLANIMLRLGLLTSNALPRIRLSLFCGEALPCELARAWSIAAPHSRTLNLYGPTEVTMFSTYHEYRGVDEADHGIVPIGVLLPGLDFMIVADGQRVQEDNVPGELWLSGDQLALGYWNNPRATEAAFVKYVGNEALQDIWYRTGDLVSRSADGGLLFRGRVDRQVKLLGHRVELEEIESVLRQGFGCALVAVVPVHSEGGICERMVAYCDKLPADERTVKDECLKHLPRYKVPARIVKLAEFPMTSSGKIDYPVLAARAKTLKS